MHQWGKHKYSYIAFLRLREFCFTYYYFFGSVGTLHNTSRDIPQCPSSNSLGNWQIPQVHTRSCIWIPQGLRRGHPELACSSLILHKGKYNVWSPSWENPFCFEAVNHMHFEIVVWLNLLQWTQNLSHPGWPPWLWRVKWLFLPFWLTLASPQRSPHALRPFEWRLQIWWCIW